MQEYYQIQFTVNILIYLCKEIEIINPKIIITLGNQVSSILLNKNISVSQCRKHFNSYKSKTIKEIAKGIFEGTDDDWNAFESTARFPYTSWFLKVIKEWYWYVDEGDGQGEKKGDCLEAYYEVKAVNG